MADSVTTDLIEWAKAIGGPTAVASLGWWLNGKFNEVKSDAAEALASHEAQDERRHRQNLVRFTKLGVRMTDEEINGGGK